MLNEENGSQKPLARKVAWALGIPGVTRERLQSLAKAKSRAAVSEWLRTGRVAKKHLSALAELTNTTVEWWLDDQAPIPPTGKWLAASQLSLNVEAVDTAKLLGTALGILGPMIAAVDQDTRKTVGALLSSWVADPGNRANILAMQTLLAPHVANKRVHEKFGDPTEKKSGK